MSNDVLILRPSLQLGALTYKAYGAASTDTPDAAEDRPMSNTMRGHRYHWWQSSYSHASHHLWYDTGTVAPKTAAFVAIARADKIAALSLSDSIDFKLQSSPDNSAWTDRHSISGLHSATLVGPDSTDYIATFTETAAIRYWRARFNRASAATWTAYLSKLYAGQTLDLGGDFQKISFVRDGFDDPDFVSSSGVRYPGRAKSPRYRLSARWDFISDASLQTFWNECYKRRHRVPVFVYTQNYHDVMDGIKLLHAKITSARTSNLKSGLSGAKNRLEVEFTEILG